MTRWISSVGLFLFLVPPAVAAPPEQPLGALIAPAFRAQRHFERGAAFLRSLPDGTTIHVERNDGSQFELALREGVLHTELPACRLEKDGTQLVSPLGYRLGLTLLGRRIAVKIVAPSGAETVFFSANKRLQAREGDGQTWATRRPEPVLRLPDGTRIDVLDSRSAWEVYTLAGERYRLEVQGDSRWKPLPKVPSPPLIPEIFTVYSAGDGDDWRRPLGEDHSVFAWNWYPYGLAIDRLIEDVGKKSRRMDLDLYFNDIDRVQPPIDTAAYLLARRLVLAGGDRLTFTLPGQEPRTVFLFPGHFEADFAPPPESKLLTLPEIPLRQKN
ncbi:MAG TPA: hypothetical protein ENK10_02075 [Acidobacteria bacterium]|nr:hypothetical protein [Acidobacteriota bacterium]